MAKVRLGSDILKPFSGEGDVVAWLKKVRLVARLQHVDDVASLQPLYLVGNALALYMEMKEEDQEDISLIEARLKESFTDGAFTAYRKLIMVRWAGERVNVYANKIKQLADIDVICLRCNSKGHIAKDWRKRGARCFQCGEIGHWARLRSSQKTTRRAGLIWPKRGGDPLNKGEKVQLHPLLKTKPRPQHKQQQQLQ